MSEDFGTITWICARRVGKRDSCGKEATHFKYGMDRCDDHEIDLSPCVWEANTRGNPPHYCAIDHETYGHIYGTECRNTPEHRNAELRKLHSAMKKLKAKKFARSVFVQHEINH